MHLKVQELPDAVSVVQEEWNRMIFRLQIQNRLYEPAAVDTPEPTSPSSKLVIQTFLHLHGNSVPVPDRSIPPCRYQVRNIDDGIVKTN